MVPRSKRYYYYYYYYDCQSRSQGNGALDAWNKKVPAMRT